MATHSRPRESGPVQRRQTGRRQRERQRQRWVLAFAAVIIFLVVAIPAYGYYATFIAPPRRTVLAVNGVKHSLGEVFKLTRASVMGGRTDLSTLPYEIFFNMQSGELVDQAARAEGLAVTQDEVDAEIRSRLYPSPQEGEQTDPQALEKEFQENYRRYLSFTLFSESEYRELVKRSLLRTKFQDLVTAQVPQMEEQVYVHWIHLTDEATGQSGEDVVAEVQKQLAAGEAFDRLARVYAADDPYADDNGEVGWVPRGAFPLLDSTLFSIERDTVSEPIFFPPDTYFIKVTDGPELLEVSEKMRNLLKAQAMQHWLDEALDKNDIYIKFDTPEYTWVVNKVVESLPAQPTPTS